MVTPTVESMKAEKITDIILVDDILGTGKRIKSSWKESINKEIKAQKTVKSWMSYKKVKLWVVSYAAYPKAIKFATQSIGPLMKERVLFSHKLSTMQKSWNDKLDDLCLQYGEITNKSGAALGYGMSRCTLIFQHGCPNNCPSILWANGKNWKSIFPNRSIPISLYPYFNNPSYDEGIEALFDTGQQQLALNLLDSFEDKYKPRDSLNIIIILGLINKKVSQNNLSTYTSLNYDEIKMTIDTCQKSGLLKNNCKLTRLGKEIVISQ